MFQILLDGAEPKITKLWNDLRSLKVSGKLTVRWSIYDFLLPFHSSYGPMLYCFLNIARYWSKITKFIYPTCIQCPRRGWSIRILQRCLVLGKLEWWCYHTLKTVWWYVKLFWYNTGAWVMDGQTDGLTKFRYQYCASELLWCRTIKTINSRSSSCNSKFLLLAVRCQEGVWLVKISCVKWGIYNMKEGPCIAGMKLGLLNKDYKLVVVVTDNNLKSMEQHFKIKNSVFSCGN